MQNELIVRVREVYGTIMYYPMNEQAKAMARIAGKKTLTAQVLWEAKHSLGYVVTTTVQNPMDWNVVDIKEVAHG